MLLKPPGSVPRSAIAAFAPRERAVYARRGERAAHDGAVVVDGRGIGEAAAGQRPRARSSARHPTGTLPGPPVARSQVPAICPRLLMAECGTAGGARQLSQIDHLAIVPERGVGDTLATGADDLPTLVDGRGAGKPCSREQRQLRHHAVLPDERAKLPGWPRGSIRRPAHGVDVTGRAEIVAGQGAEIDDGGARACGAAAVSTASVARPIRTMAALVERDVMGKPPACDAAGG